MIRFLAPALLLLLATLTACSPPVKPCDASSCAFGCCDSKGTCQPGTSDLACGAGGAVCGTCGSGLSCQVSSCQANNTGGGSGGAVGGGAGGGALGGGTGGTDGGQTGGGGGSQTGTFTLSGRVTYDFVRATYDVVTNTGTLDFAGATERPVRNAVVRVVEGTAVRAMTNTAADGAYALTFTALGTGSLSVQALAKTSTPSITVQDNTSGSAVWAISALVPVGGGTRDLRATHGWNGNGFTPGTRTSGPFAILDSAYTAASAFLAARPALQFPPLAVNWSPNNTTATNGTVEEGFLGTSYFDSEVNQVFVVGKDGVDTDEYDNHVIVHEWAHYFESNLSRSDSLGGEHTGGDVLDPREAFSEGWGNAASGMLLNDPLYADTYFTGSSTIDAFGWNLEAEPSPTDDTTPGSFSENTVMRFIYDAWDPANEGAFDGLSVGLGPIADAFTTGHRTTTAFSTIGSFSTALKGLVNVSAVDALLAHWNIGALTTDFGDGHAPLRAMYQVVATLPHNQTLSLDGREGFNFASQNKYWVLTGNGARITVRSNSSEDVSIGASLRGVEAGFADATTSGAEGFSFNSTNGTIYMINLIGYGAINGNYSATLVITSP